MRTTHQFRKLPRTDRSPCYLSGVKQSPKTDTAIQITPYRQRHLFPTSLFSFLYIGSNRLQSLHWSHGVPLPLFTSITPTPQFRTVSSALRAPVKIHWSFFIDFNCTTQILNQIAYYVIYVFLSGLLAVKKEKNEYFPKFEVVFTRNWRTRRTKNKIWKSKEKIKLYSTEKLYLDFVEKTT